MSSFEIFHETFQIAFNELIYHETLNPNMWLFASGCLSRWCISIEKFHCLAKFKKLLSPSAPKRTPWGALEHWIKNSVNITLWSRLIDKKHGAFMFQFFNFSDVYAMDKWQMDDFVCRFSSFASCSTLCVFLPILKEHFCLQETGGSLQDCAHFAPMIAWQCLL